MSFLWMKVSISAMVELLLLWQSDVIRTFKSIFDSDASSYFTHCMVQFKPRLRDHHPDSLTNSHHLKCRNLISGRLCPKTGFSRHVLVDWSLPANCLFSCLIRTQSRLNWLLRAISCCVCWSEMIGVEKPECIWLLYLVSVFQFC